MTLIANPHFLTLPPEIREHIYRLILNPAANRLFEADEYTDYNYKSALQLLRVNTQIYHESRKIFRDLNVFVRVETPWPEAQDHVAFEGHTPILMKKERAARFKDHSLSVIIDAPQSPIQDAEREYFVILLDDLPKFTKTWFYADLSHPGLNHFLRLTLRLRDPYSPSWEEPHLPKWLQRQLIMPFGMVKNLREVTLTSSPIKPFSAIDRDLRADQAIPYESAEACLRSALRWKQEGTTSLTAGRCHEALSHFSSAWEAIHVIVAGRTRHIHADAFFGHQLREAPFVGKNGQSERLMIRVQLVSLTVKTYLALENWSEAAFWGMRSINMLREAMGVEDENAVIEPRDEAVLGFPAADSMGQVYLGTATAYRELGDWARARRLLNVAAVYLPEKEEVRREVQRVTVGDGTPNDVDLHMDG